MAPNESDAVEREVRIAARPETIFPFLVEPEKMRRWKGISAELDPRPGGIYRVDVTGRDIARGEYVEVTPHSRVVFTWGWEAENNPVPPGSSTVEITLTPDGDGTIAGQLCNRVLPLERGQSHFGLEDWPVLLTCLLHVLLLVSVLF